MFRARHGKVSCCVATLVTAAAVGLAAPTADAGDPCPWDCGPPPDGNVGIVDFLELLAQWNQVNSSCDFDGGGVGIVDFLKLLANWGPCP